MGHTAFGNHPGAGSPERGVRHGGSGRAPVSQGGKIGRGFSDFGIKLAGVSGEDGLGTLTKAAFAWIDAPDRSKSPFFLYLHYIEPHSPYHVRAKITAARGSFDGRPDWVLGHSPGDGILTDSEEKRRAAWNYTEAEVRRMRQLYDGEVRYVDRNLEALFDKLS